MNLKRYFLFLLLCANVFSASGMNCRSIAVSDEPIQQNGKSINLILIHNLSTTNVWLTNSQSDASLDKPLMSLQEPERWSAFILGPTPLQLRCIESVPGHEQEVSCRGVIALCRLLPSKISEEEKEYTWAGENMPLEKLTEYLGSRGFELPESR